MPHRPWPFLVLALTAVLLACSSTPPTSESDQTSPTRETTSNLPISRQH